MRRMIVFLLAIVLLIPATVTSAQGGQPKSDVCHLDGQGNYELISISDPAVQSHYDHGDPEIGVDVYADCAPMDSDLDGIPNASDNCPFTYNHDQADSNGNGVGDVCDPNPYAQAGCFLVYSQPLGDLYLVTDGSPTQVLDDFLYLYTDASCKKQSLSRYAFGYLALVVWAADQDTASDICNYTAIITPTPNLFRCG